MDHRSRDNFSRRAFLKGSGAAAAAATALAPHSVEGQDTDDAQVLEGSVRITLNVNGQDHALQVEPRTTLLEALRYQLDLTGAKPVSEDGTSGASTVLVDGQPAMASTLLAVAMRGKKVTTVESLGGQEPDAVCRAFLAADAQQCGFCTPGFVVAVRAFLNRHPEATEQEIREGLNGNICRCGTYVDIIQAALSVVKGEING